MINTLEELENYLSELDERQIVRNQLKFTNLVFYGCGSPDDDNFEYTIFNKQGKVIFNLEVHETCIREEIQTVEDFVDKNISNISKILIIHKHDCASDCVYSTYVKIIDN